MCIQPKNTSFDQVSLLYENKSIGIALCLYLVLRVAFCDSVAFLTICTKIIIFGSKLKKLWGYQILFKIELVDDS